MSHERSALISIADLAECVGVSRRALSKAALLSQSTGRAWRGSVLEVVPVHGRGGRSGVVYMVALNSLSEPVQRALNGSAVALLPAPQAGEFTPRLAVDRSRADRYSIIAEAVALPPQTPERRDAIVRASAVSGRDKRTIARWCADFDKGGKTALGRAKPSNSGARRHVVSAVFDKAFIAAGYSRDNLAMIGRDVEQSIKGLWAGRAGDAGWADLNALAERLLLERCRELGLSLPQSAMRIGRYGIERHRQHSVVNLRRNNAKAYQDQQPGISRDWTALAPMEIVVADVKHLDVQVTRADGTTAWPKMIGFMDAGVGRIFHYLVLCEKRKSITQELVIEAFIAMATHRDWGFPQTLYLDNGSEFGGLDLITAALVRLNNDAGREIIRAMPYRAKSKPIEALFRRLDMYCFSSLPGYAGGDRQKKKTQNVGRDPEPFAGTWEQFCATVDGLIAYYHGRTVGGQWNASPHNVLRSKVEAGWRPIMPEPFALDMAFHKIKTLKVIRGVVTTARGKFYHPELVRIPPRTELQIAVPYRASDAPIAWIPNVGAVRLQPELPYAPRDIEGAKESGRRTSAYNRTVRAMELDAPPIDPVPIKHRIAADQQPVVIAGRRQQIDHGTTLHELGQAQQIADQSAAKAEDEQSAEVRRRDSATERLLRRRTSAAA